MPVRKEDAHRALELLEEYHKQLVNPQDRALRLAIEKVIRIFKGRLFQALMDIQEYYEVTLLDDTKSIQQKMQETLFVAAEWDKQPLLPPLKERRPVSQPSEEEPLPSPPPPEQMAPVTASRCPPPPILSKPKLVNATPPTAQSPVRSSSALLHSDTDEVEGHYAQINGVSDNWEYEEVILERNSGGLGFNIAGGQDTPHAGSDPSIYITKLIDGGVAARDGRIRQGDVLVAINNRSVENVSHAEVVDALKRAGNTVRLVVRRTKSTEHVTELYLAKGSKGLGFSIAGGRGNEHIAGDQGIYITKVIDGGAAQHDGRIAVGDQLLAVNDVSFESITHEEAVAVLKATADRVRLLIGKPAHHAADTDNLLHAKKEPTPSAALSGASSTDGSPVYATVNKVKAGIKTAAAAEVNITREPRRIVIRKGTAGLGFNIVGGEDGEGIFVSFILAGGPADINGELHRGDQLLSVNGVDLSQATHEQAAAVLKSSSDIVDIVAQYRPQEYTHFEAKVNSVRENIMNSNTGSLRTSQKKTMFVRALFDYDASRDSGLPNKGLSFHFGDILHVTNASDDEWWQARRVFVQEGDDDGLGIVPSKKRVEKKERSRMRNVKFPGKVTESGTAEKKKKAKKFPFLKGVGKDDDCSSDDLVNSPVKLSVAEEPILSYELVTQQEVKYARPVLVLGPLKDRINDDLLADLPRKFGNCVPHTTRQRRDTEVDGRDYHFISREQMDEDIGRHLFVEAGQYNGNLYGTSVSSVHQVAESGRHCVLDVSGQAIKRLLAAGFYPIAILTKPLSPENAMSWTGMNADEAQKQFEKTVKLEEELKQYLTAVVTGDSADDVYAKVKDIIQLHSNTNTVWVASPEKL